jgi:hypothetical protein
LHSANVRGDEVIKPERRKVPSALPQRDFTGASTGAHGRVWFDGQVIRQILKGCFPESPFHGPYRKMHATRGRSHATSEP